MAWNTPGDQDRDPWSGKPRSNHNPPDLEKVLRDFYGRLLSSKNRAPKQGKPLNGFSKGKRIVGLMLLLLLSWAMLGVFIVGPEEQAVITRFGRYAGLLSHGLHWIPPFIGSRTIVNLQRISRYEYSGQFLTRDSSVVNVTVSSRYRIHSVRDYLFKAKDPEAVLQAATASAITRVLGQLSLEEILTTGREGIREQIQYEVVTALEQVDVGLRLTSITLQSIKAPDELRDAFDGVTKAQDERLALEDKAKAYVLQVQPNAETEAQRLLTEAKAYGQQVVLKAKGDTAQFLALLPLYQKYPLVTRQRLYLETMETIFTSGSKVLIPNSINMLYLPFDYASVMKTDVQNNTAAPSTFQATTKEGRPDLDGYPTEGY